MKPYILTAEGDAFHYTHPGHSKITITAIAHALSNICRFTGHTREFYSVAQHSVLVASILPPRLALQGLLHDAHEAFVGDVNSPLKHLIPDYRRIEKAAELAVHRAFGLPDELDPLVKHADLVLLATEKRDLMPPDPMSWGILEGIKPLPFKLTPSEPEVARRTFMAMFQRLRRESHY